MWHVEIIATLILLLYDQETRGISESSSTEIFDAPDVRVELLLDNSVPASPAGFYVSKSHDLRLRCAIYLPSSVRLSENSRRIVWRYNDDQLIKAGLPTGTFHIEGDRLLLKANIEAELQVGKYSCNVTWPSYGSVLSPPVQVDLATLKKYKTDPPTEIRVLIGQTAYLPCHPPESNPTPANLTVLVNQSKEINFSDDRYLLTSTGLQIGRVEKSDQGSYLFRASNQFFAQSRDSKPIDLIIIDNNETTASAGGATMIPRPFRPSPYLHQRNTLDVKTGQNVTLECSMIDDIGRTAEMVRWEKYGSILPPVDRRKHVFGNLILLHVTREDEGTYICRAESDTTTTTVAADRKQSASSSSPSRFIMYFLRVHDPLRAKLTIERDLEEDKSSTSGFAYRLTCHASSGLASDLEFWVNGRPLLSQSLNPVRTRFQSGESPTWSFTLTEASLRRGIYQCMVRGREPFDQSTVDSDNLYVDSSFVATAKRKETESGGDDDIASGMDEPSGSQHHSISGTNYPPKIITGPENGTSTVGSPVTFVCQVSQNTDVVYWLKDGERIFDYDPYGESGGDDDEQDVVDDQAEPPPPVRYKRIGTGSLKIVTTVDQDRGWYTCVAANAYGNSTTRAYLDFEPRIGADQLGHGGKAEGGANSWAEDGDEEETEESDNTNNNEKHRGRGKFGGKKKKIRLEAPTIFRYSNTSVHLRWTLTHEQRRANSGIRFFKLQYKLLNKGDGEKEVSWKTLDQELPSHSHSGTIDELEPGRKYKFRYAVVYDNNDQALSKMTSPYEMTIERRHNSPRMPPAMTSVKSISWSAISLHWDYPSSEQAPVDGFVIMYRRIYYADTSSVFQNETVIGGWTREHVLSHLLPATLYQIKMVAFNTAGRSRESNVINESTLSTDGTKIPKTFDGMAPPIDRLFGGRPRVKDSSSPPISANRADSASAPSSSSSGVLGWLNVDLETLSYIIGGVLGASLVVCVVVLSVRHRKQKALVKAAKGKYRDASKKIYGEQSLCNEPSVMKDMYPPMSNSASFQHSAGGDSCGEEDHDHDQCPPVPSHGTMTRANGHIPPPPSITSYACNGTVRPGMIMNLYMNPMNNCEVNNADERGRRYGGLLNNNKTAAATELVDDAEETDGLLSSEHRLLADGAYTPDCDMNKNDLRYGLCPSSIAPVPILSHHHQRRMVVPPPLILTSASALTSAGAFGGGHALNHSFLSSSSPHTSVASNYSSSNAGDAQSSTNGGNSHTPLLPPPLFQQQQMQVSCNGDQQLFSDTSEDNKPQRIPTPVPSFQYSSIQRQQQQQHRPTPSDSSATSSTKAEKRRQQQQHLNGGLYGAASPMSVSSHASIGSGSAASNGAGGGTAGSKHHNFSTFKPDPNRPENVRHPHNSRNNLLLYRNRLSDGYCSDA